MTALARLPARSITQTKLKLAALMWASGRDTLTIARKIQRDEADVCRHLPRIRAVARLYAELRSLD